MGELSKEQIHRIWFPDYSHWTVERALRMLSKEGLIYHTVWSNKHKDKEGMIVTPEPGKPPNNRVTLYTLHTTRYDLIRSHTMYPFKPRGKGQERLRDHDYHSNEMLVIIHILPGPSPSAILVPWTRYAGTLAEGITIRLAIETDRSSEPPSVLAGKARAYANCGRKHWIDEHGHMPTPCWIVKDEKRLWQIWNIWKEVWPHGFWRITTDEWLKHDRWYEYFQGEEFVGDQAVSIFDPVASWRPGTEAYARREQQGRLDFRMQK
jgi:hypothetical protein